MRKKKAARIRVAYFSHNLSVSIETKTRPFQTMKRLCTRRVILITTPMCKSAHTIGRLGARGHRFSGETVSFMHAVSLLRFINVVCVGCV